MSKPTELKPPTVVNEKKDVSTKESQPVAEPLKRYEILDLPKPKPAAKTVVPVSVEGPAVKSARLTEGQTIMILLIAILIVAAAGAGAIIAINAMRS